MDSSWKELLDDLRSSDRSLELVLVDPIEIISNSLLGEFNVSMSMDIVVVPLGVTNVSLGIFATSTGLVNTFIWELEFQSGEKGSCLRYMRQFRDMEELRFMVKELEKNLEHLPDLKTKLFDLIGFK